MCDKLAEMLAARQPPTIGVRKLVRSALIRDAKGNEVRTLFAGEDAYHVEREMIHAAEESGVDLKTATLRLRAEAGQGVGKNYEKRPGQVTKGLKGSVRP